MNSNHRVTPQGEGKLVAVDQPGAMPPDKVSEGDMELLMQFQQNLAAAQQAYQALMGTFSARYQLREGDRINMDRSIERKG